MCVLLKKELRDISYKHYIGGEPCEKKPEFHRGGVRLCEGMAIWKIHTAFLLHRCAETG